MSHPVTLLPQTSKDDRLPQNHNMSSNYRNCVIPTTDKKYLPHMKLSISSNSRHLLLLSMKVNVNLSFQGTPNLKAVWAR